MVNPLTNSIKGVDDACPMDQGLVLNYARRCQNPSQNKHVFHKHMQLYI
jgi:hypothetical protein